MKRLRLNRILKNRRTAFIFLVYPEKMYARIKAYCEENKSLQENFCDSRDFDPRFSIMPRRAGKERFWQMVAEGCINIGQKG